MKKEGFTLIELLAVIFIIGIISVIAIPTVDKAIKQSREELYEVQINNIITGAKNWGAKNFSILPDDDGEYITLTLGQLKIGGFIEEDLKNPKTKKLFPNDLEITIKKVKNSYEYKVIEDSGGISDELNYNSPTIVLNGLAHEIVEIYGEYIDKGIVARDSSGSVIEDVDIVIKSNSTIVNEIDTSKLVQYKIIYTATYNGVSNSVIRTVTVKDTTPPVLTIPGNVEISDEEVATYDFMDGVHATDNSLEMPTIIISGTVSTLPGKYLITYTAKDSSENVTIKMRHVIVKSSSYPTITLLGDNPAYVILGQSYIDAGAIATDTIDGDITHKMVITTNVNTNVPGTYTVTYIVTNKYGNKTEVTREVKVIENVLPTVTFGTNGNSTWAKVGSTTVNVSDAYGEVVGRYYRWTTSTTAPSSSSFTTTFSNGETITSPSDATGYYYLWIKAVDNSGNEVITRSNAFMLDNTGPNINNLWLEFDYRPRKGQYYITVLGQANDAHSGISSFVYTIQLNNNKSSTGWTTHCQVSISDNYTCYITEFPYDITYGRVCISDSLNNTSCTPPEEWLNGTCFYDVATDSMICSM